MTNDDWVIYFVGIPILLMGLYFIGKPLWFKFLRYQDQKIRDIVNERVHTRMYSIEQRLDNRESNTRDQINLLRNAISDLGGNLTDALDIIGQKDDKIDSLAQELQNTKDHLEKIENKLEMIMQI